MGQPGPSHGKPFSHPSGKWHHCLLRGTLTVALMLSPSYYYYTTTTTVNHLKPSTRWPSPFRYTALRVGQASTSARLANYAKTIEEARKVLDIYSYGRRRLQSGDDGASPEDMSTQVATHLMRGGGSAASFLPLDDSHRDLVIGVAHGVSNDQLAVFAGSFREWATSEWSDMVILIDEPLPSRAIDIFNKYKVTSIPYDAAHLEPERLRSFHPSTTRWPLMYEYLRRSNDTHGKIMVADVSNTAFQGNPFETIIHEPGFYTFNQGDTKFISRSPAHVNMITQCFGQDSLEKVQDKPILGASISLGTREEMAAYLGAMADMVVREGSQVAKCEAEGVDQAIHNMLAYRGRISGLTVSSQSRGLVADMEANKAVVKLPEHKVVNQKSQLYTIIHNYRHNQGLTDFYNNKYRFWQSSRGGSEGEGGAASDGASSGGGDHCGGFEVETGIDPLKGRCDLTTAWTSTVQGCCQACRNRGPSCLAFAHLEGACYLKSCSPPSLGGSSDGVAMPGASFGRWLATR